ncbi:MAG: hypothetical protein ABIU54_02130 [Candidatus Eisenbacteria bacterium]
MISKGKDSLRFEAASIALVVALALPGSARAQAQPDSGSAPTTRAIPASMLRAGPMGEMLTVYRPHHPDEIQRLLESERAIQRSAEGDVAESRRLAEAADGQVRIMSEEISTTKTRLDVANKARNDADRTSLARDAKGQEAEKTYLERLRAALRADAALLESEVQAAAARVKALELEGDVAHIQAELSTDQSESATHLTGYRKKLVQMLEAQKTAAERSRDANNKRKLVAENRLKQLDALSKLVK